MRVGDIVLFRVTGDWEQKSGILKLGILGFPYVIGMDDEIYSFSMLDMIQISPGEQRVRLGRRNMPNEFCRVFQQGICRA